MNRRKFFTLIVGCVAIATVATVWLSAAGSTIESTADPATSATRLTVHSVVARSEPWPETIQAFGNIVPWEEMIVSAQVEGQPLIELRANVGEHVRKGQVLARFDSRMLRAEVSRLRAEVEQATAEVGQANAERERAVGLADSGGVSEQEVAQRVTAARVAAARLNASQAQLSARELDLQRADVAAPDDGTISARNALPGMVGTTGLELFRIIRRDRLEWRGELTAVQLARAAPGQQVLLSLPTGAMALARIRQIAPSMDTQRRLAIVYADIERRESARAGTYVSGRILLGRIPALVVPASAIVVRDGASFAFTLTSQGREQRVNQRSVEVGRRIRRDVEILSGLREGERVVAQGAGFLDDGDSVHVVDEVEAGRARSVELQ